MGNNTTIKDVARAANVSIATVSRVVNQKKTVNEEIKKRVLAAITELNYFPNSVARSLKTYNTSIIAFLVTNISDPFFIAIGRGIEDVIRDYNYSLIVCSTDNSGTIEAAYLKLLRERKVDGIVLNTTCKNNDFVSELSHSIPIVLSNRQIRNAAFFGDFIDYDNVNGVSELTSHLLSLGHRKIGVINGPMFLSTASERFKGFRSAMRRAGFKITGDYPYVCHGSFTFQGGYEGAEKLLGGKDRPTAIVTMNSELALGTMKYAVSHDINIPDDVSLVSFGDIQNYDLLYVRPTIAHTNLQALGNKIGELMIERIHRQNKIPNREIRFLTQIHYGNSTRKVD